MINIGSKIFPLFAPNTKEAPFSPIKDIARPPIDMPKINQGNCSEPKLSKIKRIGVLKIRGNIITVSYTHLTLPTMYTV